MTTFIKWLGHATVLLNEGDTWLLTDPILRRRVAHLMRRKPMLQEDWPERVDAVLISHLHQDHLDLPSLRKLGRDKPIFVPRGAGSWLSSKGFSNVAELAVGASMKIEDMTISAVPAYHSGHRPPFGPTAETVGYLMEGARTTYFAGDTELFPGMSRVADNIDIALLPIWGWGPTLGDGHLDPLQAAQACRMLKPRVAIPIHWGTLHPITSALGKLDFLTEPPEQFERAATHLAPETEVCVLRPGDEVVFG
ncbi:MAG TPA: MBL fold metallo-hydrolase [Thermomicrobiales bacterium]|nr:MBL fold metallo-hydrolase [Thermomicrobiales bacterium]